MVRAPKRLPGWVFYDPGMITNWEPPRFLTTDMVAIGVIGLLLPGAGRWLLRDPPPPGADPFVTPLAFATILPVVAMALGNSSRRLAQLFLALAGGLVAATAYRRLTWNALLWEGQAGGPLGCALGFSVLALPPRCGPIENAGADVLDPRSPPPVNVGMGRVKLLGWILIGLATCVLTPSALQAPPPTSPGPAEGSVTASPEHGPDAEPTGAAAPQPPLPQGGTLSGLNSPLTAGVIIFFVALFLSILGAGRPIQRQRYDPTILLRCIFPSLLRVRAPPLVVGTLLGLGLFYALTRLVLTPAYVGVVAGAAVVAPFAFLWAWRRGNRIFAANVARLAPPRRGEAPR